MTEEEFARCRNRYQELVSESFRRALTADEAAEEERLGAELDRHFDPFYRPIIERLKRAISDAEKGGAARKTEKEAGAACWPSTQRRRATRRGGEP